MKYRFRSSFGPSRMIGTCVSKVVKFLRQESFLQYGKYPFAIMLLALPLRQHFPGFLWEYALFEIYMVVFAGFFLIRLMPQPRGKQPIRSVKGHDLSNTITIIIQLSLAVVSSGFKKLYDFEAWFIVLFGVGSFIDLLFFSKKKDRSVAVSPTADEPPSPVPAGQ